MKKLLLLCFLLGLGFAATAQDTLWVKQKDGHPYLVHRIRNGETLFLLAKKYSVPPAVLADLNEVSYQDGLANGSKFRIPVDAYNFIRIESVIKSKPIFYKAGEEDDLRSISRLVNVSQSTIQRWNGKQTPDVEAGDVLQIGWIAYDATQQPFADTIQPAAVIPRKDTVVKQPVATMKSPVMPVPGKDTAEEESAFQQLYERQSMGVSLSEASGAAVFYPLRTKASPGVYYAFHNTAIRGTILKIVNPASGKTIYAKVIGTIPTLKEYHNAIVGLSDNAISILGATDRRMFCKLTYR